MCITPQLHKRTLVSGVVVRVPGGVRRVVRDVLVTGPVNVVIVDVIVDMIVHVIGDLLVAIVVVVGGVCLRRHLALHV
jgi:hypothetical protein